MLKSDAGSGAKSGVSRVPSWVTVTGYRHGVRCKDRCDVSPEFKDESRGYVKR